MKKTVVVILSVLLGSVISSQGQNITGQILDDEMETPLPGATIILISGEEQGGTIADGSGHFNLMVDEPGRQSIQVSFIGYEPQIIPNILTKPGKDAFLLIRLKARITDLQEVVIKATNRNDLPMNQMASVSVRSFSVEQTEKFAGSLGDPARMAQNYAGVMIAGDQRNDIIIRGNAPSGLLWRIDGLPVPNPNHFGAAGSTGGPVSMLNNNLLTRSDFYTGAFPAEFGNAISGVFDLRMRSGSKHKRQSVFQIGFNGFELGTEGPFSKGGEGTYLVNYRYSTLDVMNKLGFEVADGAVPKYQDLSFKIDLPTERAGRFQLFGLAGISSILFQQSEDNTQIYDNTSGFNTANGSRMGVIGLSHTGLLQPNTRIKTQLGFGFHQVNTQIDSVNLSTDDQWIYYGENNQELNPRFKTTLKHKFNQKAYLEAGYQLLGMKVDYADSVRVAPDQYQYLTQAESEWNFLNQAFTQVNYHVSNQLRISGGLHYQHYSLNKTQSLEPRFNVLWNINTQHSIGAGYGLHSQTQPLLVYYTQTYLPDESRILTNTDLGMTKSHQAAVNHNWMITENLRYKLEAYFQQLYDVPVEANPSTFSLLNYGASFHQERVDSLVNEGTGKNYGLELTIEKYLSNGFYFLLTGTLYESKYLTQDNIWRNTQFNGNFITNLLAGYELKLGRNFLGIDVRGVYAGGKRFETIDLEASKQVGYAVYDPKKAFVERAEPYFRTDLRLSFKMSGKKVSQEWAIDFQNLTNHQNIYSQYYNPNSGTIDYNYQSAFTPMFLYRINF